MVTRSVSDVVQIKFYQVTRSTSRTCEMREIRKKIVSQIEDEQEVVPLPDDFVSSKIRRKVLESGAVKVEDNLHAWPWQVKSHWQAALIFLP